MIINKAGREIRRLLHSLFSVDNSFLLQLIVISYLLEELDGLGAMCEARLVDSPAKAEGAREIWEMRLIA